MPPALHLEIWRNSCPVKSGVGVLSCPLGSRLLASPFPGNPEGVPSLTPWIILLCPSHLCLVKGSLSMWEKEYKPQWSGG